MDGASSTQQRQRSSAMSKVPSAATSAASFVAASAACTTSAGSAHASAPRAEPECLRRAREQRASSATGTARALSRRAARSRSMLGTRAASSRAGYHAARPCRKRRAPTAAAAARTAPSRRPLGARTVDTATGTDVLPRLAAHIDDDDNDKDDTRGASHRGSYIGERTDPHTRRCWHCRACSSANWYLRDGDRSRPLCNACGKYRKRTGRDRPRTLLACAPPVQTSQSAPATTHNTWSCTATIEDAPIARGGHEGDSEAASVTVAVPPPTMTSVGTMTEAPSSVRDDIERGDDSFATTVATDTSAGAVGSSHSPAAECTRCAHAFAATTTPSSLSACKACDRGSIHRSTSADSTADMVTSTMTTIELAEVAQHCETPQLGRDTSPTTPRGAEQCDKAAAHGERGTGSGSMVHRAPRRLVFAEAADTADAADAASGI